MLFNLSIEHAWFNISGTCNRSIVVAVTEYSSDFLGQGGFSFSLSKIVAVHESHFVLVCVMILNILEPFVGINSSFTTTLTPCLNINKIFITHNSLIKSFQKPVSAHLWETDLEMLVN
jgi:hypothetical protein